MPTKLCLIGCGNHAKHVYAPMLRLATQSDDALELTACCDLSHDQAAQMAGLAGFARTYTNYHAMLRAERPDALLLITPHTATCQIALDVIETHPCPMMIEKPPGATADECCRIRDAANARGLVNQVAFNRHFMPLVVELKNQLSQAPALQNIGYAMHRINRSEPYFYVTAIHGIDVVRFIADSDYESVRFSYQPLDSLGPRCANLFLDARFVSGVTAQLSFLVQTGLVTERFMVTCQGRSYQLSTPIWDGTDAPGAIVCYRDGVEEPVAGGYELAGTDLLCVTNGFLHAFKAFLVCARTGIQSKSNLDWAVQSMRIAECINLRAEEYHA